MNTIQSFTEIDIHAWLLTRPEVIVGFHATPFGTAAIASVDGRLAALFFCRGNEDGLSAIGGQWPGSVLLEGHEVARGMGHEIFGNGLVQTPACGLAMIGTGFQRSVWKQLMDIPRRCVATYSEVARQLGRPKAVRAVASAIGRNPMAILVPCHRVVAAGGNPGGYRWGVDLKQAIIGSEVPGFRS